MKRPLAFFGFSSAITLLILNTFDQFKPLILLIIALILFVISLVIKSLRQGRVAPIVFGAALFSCLVFVFVSQNTVDPQIKLSENNTKIKTTFCIVSEPEKLNNGYCYIIKTKSIDVPNSPQNIKLKLYTKYALEADYYDEISSIITIKRVSEKPFESYGAYGDNIFLKGYCYGGYEVNEIESKPINYKIIKVRELIYNNLSKNLDRYCAGLSYAVLTGNSSYISDYLYSCFKISGASHVMAVSGLHVSIICMGIYIVFKRLFSNEYISVAVTMICALFYVSLSSFSKSAVRASVMLFVLLVSKLFNKKSDSLNSLGFATALLCFNPFAVTDASAVLTVTSVIGILRIKPLFDEVVLKPFAKSKRGKIRKILTKILKNVLGIITATVSVLLTTFPAMCIFFGSISLASVFANVLIFAVIECVLVSSFVCAVVGGIPGICVVSAFFAGVFDKILIGIVVFISEHFNFLYVDISNEYFLISSCLILIFVALSVMIFKKISLWKCLVFSSVVLILSTIISAYDFKTKDYIYVSDNNAIVLQDKDCVVVIDAVTSRDKFYADKIINSKDFDTIAFVNSDIFSNAEKTYTDSDIIQIDQNNLIVDLCDDISVEYNENKINVSMNNRNFEIEDDSISSNNFTLVRNKGKRFADYRASTIIFTKNSQLQLRRE